MPMRVPHQTVVVTRGDKNVRPKIGMPFDFTEEEIEHFTKHGPRALRKPVNEVAPAAVRAAREAPVVDGGANATTAHAGRAARSPAAAATAAPKKPPAVADEEDEDAL